jgi:glycosyltransferase involved in cell wall biosynthesis
MVHTILHLISSEGCYGAEQMLLSLAGSCQGEGLECVIGVFEDARNPHVEVAVEAERRGFRVERIPCLGRFDTKVIGTVAGLVSRYSADVLHAHGYKADIYAWAASRDRRHALVSTCHNWPDPRPLMRIYAGADRLALRRFDAIAAVSQAVAGKLERWGVPDHRISLIRNGVEAPAGGQGEKAPLREPGDEAVVGYVGRLVQEKGVLDLLDAARVVLRRFPATRFVFVGDGPHRGMCEQAASQAGISGRVTFCGHRSDIAACYAAFDMLVLASHNEGMPMSILEAMSAGVPVVATRVGSVPDAVVDGVTGLLVRPSDTAALSKAIMSLLADRAWAANVGAAGREHASRHFSVRGMTASYIAMYRRAMSTRRSHWLARAVGY